MERKPTIKTDQENMQEILEKMLVLRDELSFLSLALEEVMSTIEDDKMSEYLGAAAALLGKFSPKR